MEDMAEDIDVAMTNTEEDIVKEDIREDIREDIKKDPVRRSAIFVIK